MIIEREKLESKIKFLSEAQSKEADPVTVILLNGIENNKENLKYVKGLLEKAYVEMKNNFVEIKFDAEKYFKERGDDN